MKIFFRFILILLLMPVIKLNAQSQTSYNSSMLLFTGKHLFVKETVLNKNSRYHFELSTIYSADNPKLSGSAKPKSESLYIGKQFLYGELLGLGFSFVGLLVGANVASDDEGWGSVSYGLFGWYMGYTFGNSLGVYLAGNNKQYKGSFIATLAGALFGAYCGIEIFKGYNQRGFGSVALMLGPPVGSIMGFNMFRKARVSEGCAFMRFLKYETSEK